VRKVFNIDEGNTLNQYEDVLGKTLGETLLTPTVIYVKPVLELIKAVKVKSLAHITGGGFYENLPRAYEEGLSAEIVKGSWDIPAIFPLIRKEGNIPEHDMYNTFNMGVGMAAFVSNEDVDTALKVLHDNGIDAKVIGKMVKGDHTVVFREAEQ